MLLYGTTFWKEVLNLPALVRHGTIASEDLQLFEFVDTPAAALQRLQACIELPPESTPHAPDFARSRCPPPRR